MALQARITLRLGQAGDFLHRLVKPGEIAVILREQSLKRRYQLGVSGD